MYKIGDLIIYGGEGVCRVEAIGTPDVGGVSEDRIYYTLKPLYREGVVFTPVDTCVHMRPVIGYDDAKLLIESIPDIRPRPCENSSIRLLSEHYDELLQTYKCIDLITLIRTVYNKALEASSRNKKLGQIDMRYLNRAEGMLHGELAVALNIPKESVREYITERLGVSPCHKNAV